MQMREGMSLRGSVGGCARAHRRVHVCLCACVSTCVHMHMCVRLCLLRLSCAYCKGASLWRWAQLPSAYSSFSTASASTGPYIHPSTLAPAQPSPLCSSLPSQLMHAHRQHDTSMIPHIQASAWMCLMKRYPTPTSLNQFQSHVLTSFI